MRVGAWKKGDGDHSALGGGGSRDMMAGGGCGFATCFDVSWGGKVCDDGRRGDDAFFNASLNAPSNRRQRHTTMTGAGLQRMLMGQAIVGIKARGVYEAMYDDGRYKYIINI